jgi:hypothetical protein
MDFSAPPEQLHANLMVAINTVDSAALAVIIRALRVIIEPRKGELDTAEAELLRESYRVALTSKPRLMAREFRLNDKGRYERATVYDAAEAERLRESYRAALAFRPTTQ